MTAHPQVEAFAARRRRVALRRARRLRRAGAARDVRRAGARAPGRDRRARPRRRVSFLDSTALGTIVGLLRRVREGGGELRVVLPETAARRIFEVTALERALDVWPSRDAALRRVEPRSPSRRRSCRRAGRRGRARSRGSRRRAVQPSRAYSRSAASPVTVSSTSSVLPSARASSLGLGHQPLGDAAAARRAADEQLGDLAAVRLVRRQREHDLHRADELAVVERGQDQPAALLGVGDEALERRARLLVRERRHVADRRAALDAVRQHGREPVEVRARARPRPGA